MLQILQKSDYTTKLLGTVLEETKNDIAILTSILNQHSVRVTNDPATKTLFKQNQENVPSFSVTIATISEHNQLAKKAISVVDEFKTYLKDSPEETETDVIISALKEVAEFNNYLELNLCNGNGTTQNSLTHSEQIPPQPDGNRVDKAQSEGLPEKK